MMHLKIARVVLSKQPDVASAMQLNGRRRKTYNGWVQQAKMFYDHALANTEVGAELAAFGIDEAKLSAGQAAVQEVQALLKAQSKEKGEAQMATKARDEALETLMDWLDDFITIARIALKDNPQSLEILGIVVPS